MAPNHFDDASVNKLIARAKKRGFVTYDELNEALPQDQMTSEQIEDIMSAISEMGVNIVESETDLVDAIEPIPYVAPLPSHDLILDGTIVRIARIPQPGWFGRWSEKGMASRLYNRLARETATETHIGFLKDTEIKHLNIEAEGFSPVPAELRVGVCELTDDTIFVITEASYWWAELKLDRVFDPSLLRFVQTTHELPGDTRFALLTPFYDGQAVRFKCPSQPQHPSILPDVTKLLEYEWREPTTLDPCTQVLEPLFSDPLCPTARFRRALNALRVELEAHGIKADDDHLNGFSGSQSLADVEPNVDFFLRSSLSPNDDVVCFQTDSISDCFDYSVASYANALDSNASEVEWNDDYDHHCRIGSPEIEMAEERTSSLIWYTAATEDRMREAMYTCQRLAPRFGLRVDFEGNVGAAAGISLDDDAA